MISLSVLDLAPVVEGSNAAQALRNSLDLAQHAEAWGYQRYWLAEHHNMDGLACSATAVLIGHIAGGTKTIRVGSGGIMLPNHAPLVVAEQFGTLATLYPGRIDLGLGRAPGTDQPTMRALRRTLAGANEDHFPQDVMELQAYLDEPRQGQVVRAIPGLGTQVPIWLLGSSLYSAQLAAHLGLPFAFASHFAPDLLMQALQIYRTTYRPSTRWPRPHAMVAVNVVAADSDEEAAFHFTSIQQRFLGMRRGQRGPLPRPVATMDGLWTDAERAGVEQMLAATAVGGPDTVARQLSQIVAATAADELIVAGAMHDHTARLRSYQILAGLRDTLQVAQAA
ncbi:MAG: LLM class flavin-dependent oxidoreductase [Rubrivivax sp.]|nr:LLM class flavin-dependent oxidoreductase [Rubrivivax sp.]